MEKIIAQWYLTDNLFLKSVSCPLKYFHSINQDREKQKNVPFRHRNKLLLRDAVALQFDDVRFTQDDTETAVRETDEWLQEQDVVICGAVIRAGNCVTRIPALKKNGSKFTIIQIHGKLRKGGKPGVIHSPGVSRTTDVYLLKAAYRLFVLQQKIPFEDFEAEFFFPSNNFRASCDNLWENIHNEGFKNEKIKADFERLFTSVSATNGVKQVLDKIPDRLSYNTFRGKSVAESVAEIEYWMNHDLETESIDIHNACKYCEYRVAESNEKKGCWSTFFQNPEISKPEKQVFELIGHGNQYHSDNGVLYQEQVPLPDSVTNFESIREQSAAVITIQQRRLLQLLGAKDIYVPEIWVKPGLKILKQIEYPLHFLDFEAATYAIPSKRNAGPYEPVFFQFSCHTLYRNGAITHSEWLDENPDTEYTNLAFAKELVGIDDIFSGTIIQYSPFEKQAVNKVIKELSFNSMLYQEVLNKLKRFRQPKDGMNAARFLDLNKLIRENYYNSFMQDKLGLKYVLNTVLQWERKHSDKNSMKGDIFDVTVDFFNPDPYGQIQSEGHLIGDGSDALDAWISLKMRAMNNFEKKTIPTVLKRYCALDSYAMFIIFKHLNKFLNFPDDSDYVFS